MNEIRVEKKFVFGKHKSDLIEKCLISQGFFKHYPKRKITSIYLDTINYDFAKDNINGVSQRKKIRFRWYNDNIDSVNLEEKNKKNFTVWKNLKKIEIKNSKNHFIKKLKEYFVSGHSERFRSSNYQFVLKTSYKRTYWISFDKKFRATIDTDIITSTSSDINKDIELPETILEFKFSPEYEKDFRNFYNSGKYNFRNHKYSKYVRSFIALEDAGLAI